ncbi:cyanophycinase [Chryseobacterium chendengshani]|uniref:cyanophycinase n=1 Tax=Chryseobacterium sp. LJ756 TaxID=2864113 RepID=UPI001C64372A|nr:cyanophycinase [Chryseobacterium sp. LJ756]MBW7674157.1 cyanophycinase [Chryseobacterium sp. LJ756]
MTPKGRLLIIGGNEDRSDSENEMEKINRDFVPHEILKLLTNHEGDRIEVITTASSEPESMREIYTKTFNEIGFTNYDFLHFCDQQLHSDHYFKRLEAANTVFFTGGDQNKICDELKESTISEILIKKYKSEEGFLIAGTSAGAMCMPKIIISDAVNGEAMLNRDIKLISGLGLIDNCIIDTHFVHRGRFSRLAHASILHQDHWGIGLGEDTALMIERGNIAKCIGSGMAVILSGKELMQTNIDTVAKGEAVYAENLKVHILTDGCSFDLKNGSLIGVMDH